MEHSNRNTTEYTKSNSTHIVISRKGFTILYYNIYDYGIFKWLNCRTIFYNYWTHGFYVKRLTVPFGRSLTNFITSPAFKFTFCSGSFEQLYFWLRMWRNNPTESQRTALLRSSESQWLDLHCFRICHQIIIRKICLMIDYLYTNLYS